MALIVDPVTGVAAKVNADGSLITAQGGDGQATFSVALNVTRLGAASAVGALLWGMRAPAGRTVIVRGGQFRVGLDTVQATAMAENAIVLVRFTAADPAAGTVQVAARKRTTDAAAATTVIRGGSGITATGVVFEADTSALARLTYPGVAGTYTVMEMEDLAGIELAPGEGLAFRAATALPIGTAGSGFLEFSERV